MMKIPIHTPSRSYNVYIGQGDLEEAIKTYQQFIVERDKVIVFTDENVWGIYKDAFTKSFPFPFSVFVMPGGEACKTFEQYLAAQTFLLEQKCSRKSMLFAFGGGAVGDLTGFVASTFMRGIPIIQLPTTILAHDSAVGGKTAINHALGKNMIGTFYQPEGVIFDIEFLKSLPAQEVRSGMAEVVKHALISDMVWLQELMELPPMFNLDDEKTMGYLEHGIRVKANIVAQDEEEHGVRKFLNFGHTYGHALEAAFGFGKLTHGEAVMIGMVYALLLSEKYGQISRSFTKEFLLFAIRNKYPVESVANFNFDELFEFMQKDKKAEDGELQFVLLKDIGKPFTQRISRSECQETDILLRELIEGVSYD